MMVSLFAPGGAFNPLLHRVRYSLGSMLVSRYRGIPIWLLLCHDQTHRWLTDWCEKRKDKEC